MLTLVLLSLILSCGGAATGTNTKPGRTGDAIVPKDGPSDPAKQPDDPAIKTDDKKDKGNLNDKDGDRKDLENVQMSDEEFINFAVECFSNPNMAREESEKLSVYLENGAGLAIIKEMRAMDASHFGMLFKSNWIDGKGWADIPDSKMERVIRLFCSLLAGPSELLLVFLQTKGADWDNFRIKLDLGQRGLNSLIKQDQFNILELLFLFNQTRNLSSVLKHDGLSKELIAEMKKSEIFLRLSYSAFFNFEMADRVNMLKVLIDEYGFLREFQCALQTSPTYFIDVHLPYYNYSDIPNVAGQDFKPIRNTSLIQQVNEYLLSL